MLRQLEIRNTHDGMIWQIYYVANQTEVEMLSATARANGFQSCEVNPEIFYEETFPNWRETDVWKERIAGVTMQPDFPEWGK
jgi:hypothetical protein